jgi:peptidyl-tRNA hydrolase, PTH1 family
MLGTSGYPRLRIGIDAPPPPIAGRDYVLGKFSPEQRPKIDAALSKAAGCCITWADEGLTKAMNQFNVKDSADERPSPKV